MLENVKIIPKGKCIVYIFSKILFYKIKNTFFNFNRVISFFKYEKIMDLTKYSNEESNK